MRSSASNGSLTEHDRRGLRTAHLAAEIAGLIMARFAGVVYCLRRLAATREREIPLLESSFLYM
jgi:hypothetical protein